MYCPNCQRKCSDNSRFCAGCGTSLIGIKAVDPTPDNKPQSAETSDIEEYLKRKRQPEKKIEAADVPPEEIHTDPIISLGDLNISGTLPIEPINQKEKTVTDNTTEKKTEPADDLKIFGIAPATSKNKTDGTDKISGEPTTVPVDPDQKKDNITDATTIVPPTPKKVTAVKKVTNKKDEDDKKKKRVALIVMIIIILLLIGAALFFVLRGKAENNGDGKPSITTTDIAEEAGDTYINEENLGNNEKEDTDEEKTTSEKTTIKKAEEEKTTSDKTTTSGNADNKTTAPQNQGNTGTTKAPSSQTQSQAPTQQTTKPVTTTKQLQTVPSVPTTQPTTKAPVTTTKKQPATQPTTKQPATQQTTTQQGWIWGDFWYDIN